MILYTLNDRTRSLGLFPFALSLGLSQAPFLKPKAIGYPAKKTKRKSSGFTKNFIIFTSKVTATKCPHFIRVCTRAPSATWLAMAPSAFPRGCPRAGFLHRTVRQNRFVSAVLAGLLGPEEQVACAGDGLAFLIEESHEFGRQPFNSFLPGSKNGGNTQPYSTL